MDSGLLHQGQLSGQPFKNTVVRIPGPSWIEKRWILKIKPWIGEMPGLVKGYSTGTAQCGQ
jgi:hypothetical protein